MTAMKKCEQRFQYSNDNTPMNSKLGFVNDLHKNDGDEYYKSEFVPKQQY